MQREHIQELKGDSRPDAIDILLPHRSGGPQVGIFGIHTEVGTGYNEVIS